MCFLVLMACARIQLLPPVYAIDVTESDTIHLRAPVNALIGPGLRQSVMLISLITAAFGEYAKDVVYNEHGKVARKVS